MPSRVPSTTVWFQMWFLLFEVGTCTAEISLKLSLTLAWGRVGAGLFHLADVSVVPLVTGQGSCEVNDSTTKKLLVIRRLDVQALLLF